MLEKFRTLGGEFLEQIFKKSLDITVERCGSTAREFKIIAEI